MMPSHLDVLRRVTREMTVARDVGEVLDSITRGLVDNADAAIARIWLYRTASECEVCQGEGVTGDFGRRVSGRALHLSAAAGFFEYLAGPHHVIPVGKGGIGLVAQTQEAGYMNEIQRDPRFSDLMPYLREVAREEELVGGAAYPLLFQGELLGVLGIFTRHRIDESEFEHIGIFADQAATAIRTAQLFGEVEELRERLVAENRYLQEEIRGDGGFSDIVGSSGALRSALDQVRRVAPTETSVLLLGETGTGKELLARAIHELSPRGRGPLIRLNRGAMSAGLVERELFGHERGAFTGAVAQRVGRFELADGGTLFMDEVGELPADTQVKLLRVLQDGELERVGGSSPIPVSVRVVAATNRDLEEEVRAGRFRADLYYRLNMFPIRVPPLRERLSDIPELVAHYLARFGRELGKPLERLAETSMERLQRYTWPGNVRELQNVLERACVLATGPVVDIGNMLQGGFEGPVRDEAIPTLQDAERAHIRRALEATGGRISGPHGAARILDIHPNTLRSRMERLGMRGS